MDTSIEEFVIGAIASIINILIFVWVWNGIQRSQTNRNKIDRMQKEVEQLRSQNLRLLEGIADLRNINLALVSAAKAHDALRFELWKMLESREGENTKKVYEIARQNLQSDNFLTVVEALKISRKKACKS